MKRRSSWCMVSRVASVLGLLLVAMPWLVRGEEPVDPQATAAARDLLHRITQRSESADGRFWIGQNFGHSGVETRVDFQRHVGRLADETGQWPALLAVDYAWNQVGAGLPMTNRILIDHWKQGGIVSVSAHLPNPWFDSNANDVRTGNWEELFQSDSAVHRRWRATLDEIAEGLEQLQQAGVPVLWRPYHEMNGNWFWWSACEQDESQRTRAFQRLWSETYRYLTVEKRLHHLLWVYAPSVAVEPRILPVNRMFPGQNQVDVVGCDYYGDPKDEALRAALDQLELLNKPRGLCEFGFGHRVEQSQDNLQLVDAIEKQPLKVAFVVYWHSWPESRMAIVDHHRAKELMSHERVLTRDAPPRAPAP